MRALALSLVVACSCSPALATVALTKFSVESSSVSDQLFLSVGSQTPAASNYSGAASAWSVTVNTSFLAAIPTSVIVNFPDRATANLARDHAEVRPGNSFVWSGRGNGCSGIFTSYPGGFLGTISCLNAPYGVMSSSNGTQLVRFDGISTLQNDLGPATISPAQVTSISNLSSQQIVANGDSTVDVLVLYTASVRQALDPAGGRANTIGFMQHSIDVAQEAMVNSTSPGQPVIAQLNFIHAQEVARSESNNFDADIIYLQGNSEPIGIRNFWAADIVLLITEGGTPNYCGKSAEPSYGGYPAPGPAFAPFSTSAVKRTCSFANYAFQHELAHQLGANHNVESDNNATPLEPWAFGHWASTPDGGNRTIMSYLIPQCTAPCPEVLNYSNADVYVDTFRTGKPGLHENARVIGEFSITTAQYRASLGRIFADGFE